MKKPTIITQYSNKKLLYKFKVDLWGTFILQKKFNIKLTKKILFDFESNVRHNLTSKLKKQFLNQKNNYHKILDNLINTKLNLEEKDFFFDKSNLENFDLLKKNKDLLNRVLYFQQTVNESEPGIQQTVFLKNVFFSSLLNYFTYFKNQTSIISNLESIWFRAHIKRLKFDMPKIIGRAKVKHRYNKIFGKYFTKPLTLDFIHKLELLKQQHFFCFSNISKIRRYIKRVEFLRRPDTIFLGLEGNLLNILFRTNLFINTKQVYNFVKLGAVCVNDDVIKKPYRILSVFDFFSIHPKFVKTVWNIFFNKLKNKQLLVNIPNYLDYDYKLMKFFIWRLPTDIEKRFVYYYPFLKPSSQEIEVYSERYNQFVIPERVEKNTF